MNIRVFIAARPVISVIALLLVNCEDAGLVPAPAPDPVVEPRPVPGYSPLAFARARVGRIVNREAVIPPQCYTKTDGLHNPCWTCHTRETLRNHMGDWELQREYAFSEQGLTNSWDNLFRDISAAIAAIPDEDMLRWIREDNYAPFAAAMQREEKYTGWLPDLDLALGFDEEGLARDGSWWRAFRFKPFPGTFWPTNGAMSDLMIRLPEPFYSDAVGDPSREIYKVNLALVEASLTVDARAFSRVGRRVEPVSETVAGMDLDGDLVLEDSVTVIRVLPERYAGGASGVPVRRNLYPEGTEFLHTLRYLDPDDPDWFAARLKEVRYAVKFRETDAWSTAYYYEEELEHKDRGLLPLFQGDGTTGLANEAGWRFQGFIEDAEGRLRAQTDQEHYYCMGCHSTVGVTADQTFGFPRKVPGSGGWGYQSLVGIPDVPQYGHDEPEILTYFKRTGGGDEFRNNAEMIRRFVPGGEVREEEMRRAAAGGDRDLRHLLLPSRERAYLLNKAYMVLVAGQEFESGRDPMIAPPVNVHRKIIEISAGLPDDRIFRDGTIWLDWTGFAAPALGGEAKGPP